MGNTLPKNPTREELLTYAEKQKGDKAIEIYERVILDLKIEKKLEEAADVIKKCIPLYTDKSQVYAAYENIAKLYKKLDNIEKYIETLKIIIKNNREAANFSNCGKYCVCIAQEYEKKDDIPVAVEFYTQARDYYEISNLNHFSSECNLKNASLLALLEEDSETARDIFESLADTMYTTKNKSLAANYVFNAGLCKLKSNSENMHECIDYYGQKYTHICDSSYYKFLKQFLLAVESKDTTTYDSVVSNYNLMFGADSWTTKMFKVIKEKMEAVDLK